VSVIDKGAEMKDRCLTDEEITAYIDGVVSPEERARIEAHLAKCGFCLHTVAELKQLVTSNETSPVAPTEVALSQAEAVILENTDSPTHFDIALVIRDGICKILDSTGDLLPPRRLSPAAVRRQRSPQTITRISKSLSGFLVTVELKPERKAVKPEVIIVEESTSERPDGLKAKLYSPGACETRYSEQGRISFSPLSSGYYRIEIEEIGTIGLEIKGS